MEHIRVNNKIRLETLKMSMKAVVFETIDRDREYLQKWLPFVAFTKEVADTERFIAGLTQTGQKNKETIYSIWYKENFAGLVGFKDTDWTNRKTEIGYWLAENMQGKGIASETVKKLIRYAFTKQHLNRIQIKVAEGNKKSEAIPIRLGFSFEGIERAGEFHENNYLNLKVYSLLKTDLL
jgi:ribosomal-protein-serine acetyltransferase